MCLFLLVWSDDDWLKKFSGKTLEENKEEEGPEPPKAETQEVRRKVVPPPEDRLSFPISWGLRCMCSQSAEEVVNLDLGEGDAEGMKGLWGLRLCCSIPC